MYVAPLPIEVGTVQTMFSVARAIFCYAVFPGLISTALAQTAIDDVHITPRPKAVMMVANAALPTDSAGLAPGSLLRTSVNLVMVPVTITDDRYRPVIGLDQENFQLFEGKKAQQIKHFSSEDAPISIGIVVDTSGSMSYKLDRAREAVAQFCDTANPQDEFFLITFADSPVLATDFTSDTERIESDLLLARSKGQTSLLDAIYMAIGKMRNARYGRKALLILSDGGDNHSRYTERDIRSAVKEADVLIYAVGIYESYVATPEELLGPELLSSVTELTGGHAFTLNNLNDMPDVTRAIGTQLRYQYMLAYQPQSEPHDGKWHKISVKLRLPKHLNFFAHVEARPGYYAAAQ
jgi:Ca-activated chloride channel family protein